MKDNDLLYAAKLLFENGIELIVDGNIEASPEDIPAIINDKDGWIASKYGVSKELFLRWRSNEPIICSEKTTKGKRCKNHVVGCFHLIDPKDYEALIGGYCKAHGG